MDKGNCKCLQSTVEELVILPIMMYHKMPPLKVFILYLHTWHLNRGQSVSALFTYERMSCFNSFPYSFCDILTL